MVWCAVDAENDWGRKVTGHSPAELGATFDRLLRDIIMGQRHTVPTCTGLDWQTIGALNRLAAQPDRTASAVAACRAEFGRMLDGTHAAQDQDRDNAEWDQLLRAPDP